MTLASVLVRVLVADDHPIVRASLVSLLAAHAEISVIGEAGDGEAAVARSVETAPDAVLMNLQMPKLTGAEATEPLLAERPHTRVVDRTCDLMDSAKGVVCSRA